MICAIVLAAGRSRRMGAQKLLLPLGDRPLVAWVVDVLLSSPVDQVIVVTGPEGRGVRDALAGRPVQFVANHDPEGEMLSSVRCGLAVLPAAAAGVLVALGDQPGIRAGVVAALVHRFEPATRRIIVPTYGKRRGHPLLFASSYRAEILTQYDQVGLRGLLQQHPEDVLEVEVADAHILEDIDDPEDYQQAVAGHGRARSIQGRSVPAAGPASSADSPPTVC